MPSALPLESRRPAGGHEPVLADEVVRMLAARPGQTVVDCTFGAGGHARRIAPALGEGGRYIAIDRDPEARSRITRQTIELFAAGKARPPVFARMPLSEAARAHELLDARRVLGKLILQP